MGSGLVFGGTLVASVLAGSIALFAPCCISVMLPAYLAGAFQNRGRRVAMTFLYGVGVATVILPIALGAIVLRQVIFGDHAIVFTAMGMLLLALGLWVLAGGQLHLPAPGGRHPGRGGPLGVYLLGRGCCKTVELPLSGGWFRPQVGKSEVRSAGGRPAGSVALMPWAHIWSPLATAPRGAFAMTKPVRC